jgi:hypothetical protein
VTSRQPPRFLELRAVREEGGGSCWGKNGRQTWKNRFVERARDCTARSGRGSGHYCRTTCGLKPWSPSGIRTPLSTPPPISVEPPGLVSQTVSNLQMASLAGNRDIGDTTTGWSSLRCTQTGFSATALGYEWISLRMPSHSEQTSDVCRVTDSDLRHNTIRTSCCLPCTLADLCRDTARK